MKSKLQKLPLKYSGYCNYTLILSIVKIEFLKTYKILKSNALKPTIVLEI